MSYQSSFVFKIDELHDEYLGGERVSPQLRGAIREVLEDTLISLSGQKSIRPAHFPLGDSELSQPLSYSVMPSKRGNTVPSLE